MQSVLFRSHEVARAAALISETLTIDAVIDRKRLNDAMQAAFGVSDATGAWSQRDSFEMLELAVAAFISRAGDSISHEAIATFATNLPTQTVRSEEQVEFQQFSTPVDIAWLVAHLAAITPDDVVLEPSAGTGLLAAPALRIGAKVHLNELNEHRYELLESAFKDVALTRFDGSKIDTLLASMVRPSVIVMNPPFARDLGRGEDPYAAIRHLRSAIRLLRPGGRLVAVMPDWFTSSPKMKEIFEKTFANVNLFYSGRLDEGAYRKHGTSIAVRIYAIDKIAGSSKATTFARASALDLFRALPELPARSRLATPMLAIPVKSGASLISGTKTAKPLTIAPIRAAQRNEVLDVDYDILEEPAPAAEQVGIYIPYRPSRVKFATAGQHPTALVESIAMGSIPMPKPDYQLRLPELAVKERLLSDAQLETVLYANNQWEMYLPGTFKTPETGVILAQHPEGARYRKGFFLGDGTGAGKGRQVAACIMEQWLRGNRRAIWISKNEPLLEDARRDWSDLGGVPSDIVPVGQWKIHEPITMQEGILFVTYPTLRSQRENNTRLRQILDWAGPKFEGVIAFDEAHEMGGVAGGEGSRGKVEASQQGIAGVALQNHLPEGRVIYASATGASDVNNLAYAVRLGLWGPGTAFENRESFIAQIREGGIAAMELVARDLKANGQYIARSLSFAGVEYEILKHKLTPDQIEIYDIYAQAWAIIHRNMEDAMAFTGVVDDINGDTLNSGAKAAARSRFESTKQRFFNQLILSLKLPSMIADMEQKLENNFSCVVQIVTTAESILDRRLNRLDPEAAANLEIDLSPREYVIDYLERAFPVRQMMEYTDDQGNTRSQPMSDASGNPVLNQQAIEIRQSLIEQLCGLPAIPAALDAIINHFGADRVAEITGRSKRLLTLPNGDQKLETRSLRSNQAETTAFMSGQKRILVFSDAGGTGRSYHASLTAKNQQQRAHYLAEPGWRADRAIQGLGRTHRTHQASAPLFIPLTSDVKAELRFTSTIARRLDSLGALTRGQRQTGGQNLFDPADNLESTYAKAALTSWYHLLYTGKLKSVALEEFERMTGLSLTDKDGALVEDLPPITRFLNRLLALRISVQNAIFDEFLALIETRVQAARDAGTLDIGVETIAVEHFEVMEDILLRTDQISGATTLLKYVKVGIRKRPMTLSRALSIAEGHRATFVLNEQSGRVALRLPASPTMTDTGEFLSRSELMHPLRREVIYDTKMDNSHWRKISHARFSELWQAEYEASHNQIDEELIYLATGLLLPIWNRFPNQFIEIKRISADDGSSLLGRIVNRLDVTKFLEAFGKQSGTVQIDPSQVLERLNAGQAVPLAGTNDIIIKRSLVNGSNRFEISKYPYSWLSFLKSMGCFTEVIAYKTRIFIPVDQALDVIQSIIDHN